MDGEDYVYTIPKAGSMEEITDKLDFIKIKTPLFFVKNNVKNVRRQATDWRK